MPHFLIMRHANLALLSLKRVYVFLVVWAESIQPAQKRAIFWPPSLIYSPYKTNLSVGLMGRAHKTAYTYNPSFAAIPLGLVFYADHRRLGVHIRLATPILFRVSGYYAAFFNTF
jgi:hypothetical protein